MCHYFSVQFNLMMMLGCHRKVVDFSLISILKWESKVTVITGVAKAGFHWQRSRSRSRKSASDLVKIENRSRKRSHKFDGIGDGRIRTVPFSSDSTYDSNAYDPLKTRLSESQAEVLGLFFGFHLRLRQPSFHWIINVGVISGIGRKWNLSDSAYDSDVDFH